MEKIPSFIYLLLLFVGIPSFIFYANKRHRNLLREADLPKQGFLSSNLAFADMGKNFAGRRPLIFNFIMILFGAIMFVAGLPLFGIAFILLFGTLFMGYLCGWAIRAPQPHIDFVPTNRGQIITETAALAEQNKAKVPKLFQSTLYVVIVIFLGLIAAQAIIGPISIERVWPSLLLWFI